MAMGSSPVSSRTARKTAASRLLPPRRQALACRREGRSPLVGEPGGLLRARFRNPALPTRTATRTSSAASTTAASKGRRSARKRSATRRTLAARMWSALQGHVRVARVSQPLRDRSKTAIAVRRARSARAVVAATPYHRRAASRQQIPASIAYDRGSNASLATQRRAGSTGPSFI